MVLATRIKDAKRQGFIEGEAKGEAKKSKETAIKMLRKNKPLSEIMEFSGLSKEDIVSLANENGLEVVVA